MSSRGVYGVYIPDESNHIPPTKFAADEIRNCMFLPLMIEAVMGIGGKRQNYSFFSYNKIFCPNLAVIPQRQIFFKGELKKSKTNLCIQS